MVINLKIRLKLYSILSVLIGILAFSCVKVKAVDLKFYAVEDKTGNYYTFYTTVAASQHSKDVFKRVALRDGYNEIEAREKLYITPESGQEYKSYAGGDSWYDVTGILIHDLGTQRMQDGIHTVLQNNSVYHDVSITEPGYIKIGYDAIEGDSCTSNYLDEAELKFATVNTKSFKNDIKNATLKLESQYYNRRGEPFYTQYTISKDGEKVIYKYFIRKKEIEDLYKSKSVISKDGDYYVFRVSLALTTLFDPNNPENKTPKTMYTSEQFYSYMYSKNSWGAGNLGLNEVGTSAANDMDNNLYIPITDLKKCTIKTTAIIHHFDGTETPHAMGSNCTFSDPVTSKASEGYFDVYIADIKNKKDIKITLNDGLITSDGNKYMCTQAEVLYENTWEFTDYKIVSNLSGNISTNKTINLTLSNDNVITVTYHFYPNNHFRDIYVGYFDENGNKLEIGKNVFIKNTDGISVSNKLSSRSKAEEKYQTLAGITVDSEKNIDYSGKKYYLKEIKVHKFQPLSYPAKYSEFINYDEGTGKFNFSNFDQTITEGNSYAVPKYDKRYTRKLLCSIYIF